MRHDRQLIDTPPPPQKHMHISSRIVHSHSVFMAEKLAPKALIVYKYNIVMQFRINYAVITNICKCQLHFKI